METDHGDATDFYQKLRGEAESLNSKVEGLGIKGTEGWMFYCECEDGVTRQFKGKPESIEAIHWSGGLTKRSIRTTCQNAFETTDDPDIALIKKMLLEENDLRTIEAGQHLILGVLDEVRNEMGFRDEVLGHYARSGMSIIEDRPGTMRHMSQFFPKNKMKYVFWIIANAS